MTDQLPSVLARVLRAVAVLGAACLVAAACSNGGAAEPDDPRPDSGDDEIEVDPDFERIDGVEVTDGAYGGSGLDLWAEEVPGIADVRIPSSMDEYQQPALWLAHQSAEPRPLLVVLHSWSVDYQQHMGIPYARWALENDWAMIHPDFRGVLETSEATGSDLAVQDVIDAIDYAADHAAIDEDQVFVTGFSGGGMMSLNMAGRHPDRFAGVAAWVPIHDLIEWYSYQPNATYARQIEQSCGGNPVRNPDAAAECLHRSPSAHLDAAREAGVPIYIGHGLSDGIVPISHGLWAFSQLADPDDHFSESELVAIASGTLPEHLRGAGDVQTFFAEPDPPLLYARQSANVTLVIFEGGHLGVFNPGLEWIVNRSAEIDAQ